MDKWEWAQLLRGWEQTGQVSQYEIDLVRREIEGLDDLEEMQTEIRELQFALAQAHQEIAGLKGQTGQVQVKAVAQ